MRSLALTLALAGFTLPASSAFAQDTSPGDEAPSERAPAGEASAPSADLDLYREASLLLHRRDYAAAQARFEELLRRYPQSRVAAEARFWSATALEELGRKGEALAAYRALVAQHAQSGWSRDAAARIARLEGVSTSRADALACEVQLTEGEVFAGTLHGLEGRVLVISGGALEGEARIDPARIQRLRLTPGGARRLIVLDNGDRVSGRLLGVEGQGFLIEVPGVAEPLRVPVARVRGLRVPGDAAYGIARIDSALASPAVPMVPLRPLPLAPRSPFGAFPEERAEADGVLERETKLNPDGSRTTTTRRKDGRTTTTTVQREGEGRRVVVVREGEGPATRIELKLDGAAAGEALLGELAEELPAELGARLGDLDLDLDFEIDEDEQGSLEEALERLPRELRERILRSLHGRQGRSGKTRRVWLERGRARPSAPEGRRVIREGRGPGASEEERVIILEGEPRAGGPRTEKRVIVVEGEPQGEPEPGARREKHVMVFEGEPEPGARREKHVMVFEGEPEPGARREKRVMVVKGEGGGPGVEEELEVFVTPDGRKEIVRRRGATRARALFPTPAGAQGPRWVYEWSEQGAQEQRLDRVFLRNGDALSGTIRGLDAESLRLDTDYGQVTIRRDKVREVRFATPPQPFLGVSMKEVPTGVEVTEVHAKSAAEQAGFQAGDVILRLGGSKEVLSVETLREAIEAKRVGETLGLEVQRGEERLTLQPVLKERPKTTEDRALRTHAFEFDEPHHELRGELHRELRGELRGELHGEEVEEVEPLEGAEESARPRLGIALSPTDKGLTIREVMSGSPAAKLGLKAGDRILRFQGQEVKTFAELSALFETLKRGGQVSLQIERQEGERTLVLQLQFTLD